MTEGRSLRVTEIKMLRKVNGTKWDDVTGSEWHYIVESFIARSIIECYSSALIKRTKCG